MKKNRVNSTLLFFTLASMGSAFGKHAPYDPNANRVELGIKHHHAELDDLVDRMDHDGKKEPVRARIYSLDEMVRLLKYENIDLRINAEKVYQAKKGIDVRIGALLPSLNFGNIIAASEQNYFDLVPSLLGFMFPSNWFRWEESILFFEAERWGHMTLSANQVNALLSEIYKVSYCKRLIEAYEIYHVKMQTLAAQARARLDMGEGRLDAKLELENLEILLHEDIIALRTEVKKLKYYLSYIVNLDESRWNNFEIEDINIPDLAGTRPLVPAMLLDSVVAASPEKMELEYLIEASRFSTKSRMFDFLNPDGDGESSLGFGYVSQIKIGKSQTTQLHLQMEELLKNLKLATYRASEDYNLALYNYKSQSKGLANAQKWFDFLEHRFYEGGEYEAQDFVEAVSSMLEFHSKQLNSQHQFMISAENIRRLTLGSPYYQGLEDLTPRSPYKSLCLTKKLENRKIKKARKSGKLKLPI